ncbi:MAG: ABC transporter ATP-binding protein [Candidatus Scalindua sp.]|nr:ABC transporter ATP-binding protein [Candidatus Scalindua sp.]MCR4343775.1 ABC transporter ATP-binding protein [Candidatus Scalindua sp.]
MKTNNCITLKDVSIGYNNDPILSNINFSVKPGEYVVLFGPNGSGKTTLFKTILRIIPPLRGSIVYDNDKSPGFGYVPQRQYLDEIYPFTVEEVVLMGTFGQLRSFCPIPKASRALGERCLKDVGMLKTKSMLFAELSGGQKQRVLIARALTTKPTVLLLDEPITGVDITARKTITNLITSLHKKHQLTIIMVTHELHHIPEFVNKIIHIHDRKLLLTTREKIISASGIDEIIHYRHI